MTCKSHAGRVMCIITCDSAAIARISQQLIDTIVGYPLTVVYWLLIIVLYLKTDLFVEVLFFSLSHSIII